MVLASDMPYFAKLVCYTNQITRPYLPHFNDMLCFVRYDGKKYLPIFSITMIQLMGSILLL